MNLIESHPITNDNQFGFKKKTLYRLVYIYSIIICTTVLFIVSFWMRQKFMIEIIIGRCLRSCLNDQFQLF